MSTELIALNEEQKTVIQVYNERAVKGLALAKELVVSKDNAEEAQAFLQKIKNVRIEKDKLRQQWKAPVNELAKKIEEAFKDENLTNAETIVNDKICAFLDEQDRIVRQQEREAQDAANAAAAAAQAALQEQAAIAVAFGDNPAEVAAQTEQKSAEIAQTAVEQVEQAVSVVKESTVALKGGRSKIEFEIINEAQVPRELCISSEKLIREFRDNNADFLRDSIKNSADGFIKIKGIKFFAKKKF